jgi:hypothetical protein
MVIDIKNFYLNTPLGRFEYMVINLASLPQETIEKYDLNELAQDGKVYIEIQKGMYGFPQAGILANRRTLQKQLDWNNWLAAEWIQLEKYDKKAMFGAPCTAPVDASVFYWI